MGDSLAPRASGKKAGNGGSWGLVYSDWRAEQGALSVAICGFERETNCSRKELGRERVEWNGPQDSSIDPTYGEQDYGASSLESCWLGCQFEEGGNYRRKAEKFVSSMDTSVDLPRIIDEQG